MVGQQGIEMNLTEEQGDLLSTIVQVYDSGCKGEFILIRTMTEPNRLVYSGHPNVVVRADPSDFRQLAQEGLITIRESGRGDLHGKPTGKGISVAHSWVATATEPIEPLGSRHQGVGIPDVATGPDVRSAAGRAEAAHQLLGGSGQEKQRPQAVIFIGHGGAKDWLELKEFLKEQLHLGCVEFNSESAAGIPTQERLQSMLEQATFAFLVMTGEDEHADGRAHARENVIHEAGLFQAKLGFRKAILLVEDGCERPSNIHGLTHIGFPKGRIRATFHDVREVLERERIL